MKRLFVCLAGETLGDDGSSVIAGSWDIDTLNAGALAVFDEEGELIDASAPAFSGKRIYLGMGTSEGHPDISPLIPNTMQYSVQQYAAADQAEKYLGSDAAAAAGNGSLNYPASISAGEVVGIDIVDLTKPTWHHNRTKRYEFLTTSSSVLTGKVAGNVIYDLVALINADPDAIVTATAMEDGSNNCDGIKLVADTAGNDFNIGVVPGVLGNADVVEYLKINGEYNASSTTAVPNNVGTGLATQIAELETEVNTWLGEGIMPKHKEDMFSRTSKVVAGQTYDVVTIRFAQDIDTGLIRENNPEQIIYVAFAVADRATTEANFLNILDYFVNKWDEVTTFGDTQWVQT